ncbi:MAG: M48 family metallopeptidase [Victivallaceae bacterium]|nr:M48 family metallopeptidase [Victivallaceae bacterium]MDD4180491.1 M48 family metallopeptidase [Victivallaceae bacterium]
MEYAFIIIIILYALNQSADLALEVTNYIHLKRYGAEIPAAFEASIDPELFSRSRRYNMAKSRFTFFSGFYNQVIILIFIFGLVDPYNELIESLPLHPIARGVVFFLLLIYAKAILNFPFNLYRLFVLERRFGFSTITFKVWFSDQLKSFVVSTIIIGAALSGMFWLVSYEYTKEIWWLPVWAVFFLFTVFIVYISPNVLQPLFNKFVPLEDRDLNKRIKALLEKCGVKVRGVYTMDASKRTLRSNAYFTGIGAGRRIVLFDTLINKLSKDELLAVLAHEAAHAARGHVAKNLVLLGVLSLFGTWIAFIVLSGNYLADVFKLTHSNFHVQLILLSFVSSILCCGLPLLMNAVSRHFERQADRFVVKVMGNGKALASALVKLSTENLSNVNPQRTYAFFNNAHPPAVSRVRKLRHYYK